MQLSNSSFFRNVRPLFKSIYWAWIILWFLDMVSLVICLFIPPPDNSFSRFVFYVNLGYARLVILSMLCLAITIAIVSIVRRKLSMLESLVFFLLCVVLIFLAPNWRT